MFWRVAEYIAIVLTLVVFCTQIALPLGRGQKTFPLFRRQGKWARLAEALREYEEAKK